VIAHLWVWTKWLSGSGLIAVVGLVLSIVLWRRKGFVKRLLALVVFVGLVVSPSLMARAALQREGARYALRRGLLQAGASDGLADRVLSSPSAALMLRDDVDAWRRAHGYGSAREAVQLEVLLALMEHGALRLRASEQVHLLDLWLALAQSSPAVCAQLPTHELDMRGLLRALDTLAPEEQGAFFSLAARAGELELRGEPEAGANSEAELRLLRSELDRLLPRDQAGWLRQTLDSGSEADASSRCQAYLLIARAQPRLSSAAYRVATRYLLAPTLTP
jgi:hypothetical protein